MAIVDQEEEYVPPPETRILPSSSHQDQDDELWLVSCRCESARTLSTLLTCLQSVAASGGTHSNTSAPLRETYSSFPTSSWSPPSSQQGGRSVLPKRRSTTRSVAFASSVSTLSGVGGGGIAAVGAVAAFIPVTVFCSPTGLTFHVSGRAKQMQASVEIPAQMFADYRVLAPAQQPQNKQREEVDFQRGDKENDEPDWHAGGEFSVNLSTLLDCIHVMGTQDAILDKIRLYFSYHVGQELFKLELLDQASGILSTAAIPGMQLSEQDDLGNSLALAFRSSPIFARMIVKSSILQDSVLSELQLVTGAATASVALSITHGLQFAVVGYWEECMVSIPPRGSHVVSLQVVPTQQSKGQSRQQEEQTPLTPRSYPLHALLSSFRGLDIAQETCITINQAGMMAIQHQVIDSNATSKEGTTVPSFVDCILSCLEEDNDADECGTMLPGQVSTTQETEVDVFNPLPQTQETTVSTHRSSSTNIVERYTPLTSTAPPVGPARVSLAVAASDDDDDRPMRENDDDNKHQLMINSSNDPATGARLFGTPNSIESATTTSSSQDVVEPSFGLFRRNAGNPDHRQIRQRRIPHRPPYQNHQLSPPTIQVDHVQSVENSGGSNEDECGCDEQVQKARSPKRHLRRRRSQQGDGGYIRNINADDDDTDQHDDKRHPTENGRRRIDHHPQHMSRMLSTTLSQPLDVTAPASPPPSQRYDDQNRDEDCSSPELIYGQQD